MAMVSFIRSCTTPVIQRFLSGAEYSGYYAYTIVGASAESKIITLLVLVSSSARHKRVALAVGRIGPDVAKDNWNSYMDGLDQYFIAKALESHR